MLQTPIIRTLRNFVQKIRKASVETHVSKSDDDIVGNKVATRHGVRQARMSSVTDFYEWLLHYKIHHIYSQVSHMYINILPLVAIKREM